MEIKPIAYIKTDFKEKFGIPRQSGRVPSLVGKIVFEPKYKDKDALREIKGFSHLWLIFDFSESHRSDWSPTVRPPRLGGNKRVGVFASRSPFRPNHLGLSCVELLDVVSTDEGEVLLVSGVDLLDGTPIYDIKPYIPHADCRPDATGGYADEFECYRLEVDFPPELLLKISKDKRKALVDCIAEDPRPSYHEDGRGYSMLFDKYDVSFVVEGGTARVTGVKVI